MPVTIVPAGASDSKSISQIAMSSKAHWGYDRDFMQAAAAELEVSSDRLCNPNYDYQMLCNAAGEECGFYALNLAPALDDLSCYQFNPKADFIYTITTKAGEIAELEGLFVSPMHMGKGYGKALFAHAKHNCQLRKVTVLLIQSDPNALDFYVKQGCQLLGSKESGSITGRHLPLLSYSKSV